MTTPASSPIPARRVPPPVKGLVVFSPEIPGISWTVDRHDNGTIRATSHDTFCRMMWDQASWERAWRTGALSLAPWARRCAPDEPCAGFASCRECGEAHAALSVCPRV